MTGQKKKMSKLFISPNKAETFGIKIAKDGVKRSAFEILSRDGVDFNKLRSIWNNIPLASQDEEEQLEMFGEENIYRKERSLKYRYVTFNTNKRRKKELMKKLTYSILPYPKKEQTEKER